MKKITYLITRTGSNSANQPMQHSKDVCFVVASSRDNAILQAAKEITVYNNQTLDALPPSKVSSKRWNDANERNIDIYYA